MLWCPLTPPPKKNAQNKSSKRLLKEQVKLQPLQWSQLNDLQVPPVRPHGDSNRSTPHTCSLSLFLPSHPNSFSIPPLSSPPPLAASLLRWLHVCPIRSRRGGGEGGGEEGGDLERSESHIFRFIRMNKCEKAAYTCLKCIWPLQQASSLFPPPPPTPAPSCNKQPLRFFCGHVSSAVETSTPSVSHTAH